ncbi:methyl-accepting chemotaxis protein [Azospirillaceae bacterium]
MRDNGPVTGREYALPPEMLIVSRTDERGVITFVNRAFVEASGFTERELLGSPHNILRHPDMPKEAFANLWETIRAGRPWNGLVKNRRRDGDHYWVVANVTPIIDGERIVGYTSIRTPATREQVALAEQAYTVIRREGIVSISLRDGQIIANGSVDRAIQVFSSLSHQMAFGLIMVIVLMTMAAAVALSGLMNANDAIRSIHDAGLAELATTRSALQDAAHSAALWLVESRAGGGGSVNRAAAIEKAVDEVETAEKAYALLRSYSDESKRLSNITEKLVKEFRSVAVSLKEAKVEVVETRLLSDLAEERKALDEMIARSIKGDTAVSEKVQSGYILHLSIAVVLGTLAVCFSLIGNFVTRSAITKSMGMVETHFEAILRGNFSRHIDDCKISEFWRITSLLKEMQAKFGYASQERMENQKRAEIERKASLTAMVEKFQADVGGVILGVANAVGQICGSAGSIAHGQEAGTSRSVTVASAAISTQKRIQELAAATEKLAASIREITRQVGVAAEVSRLGVVDVDAASSQIARLDKAAGEIGQVVKLIRDVASQTNLLALNATIEAARAGEAGRGFAVVANEVKALANQTAQATNQISQQVVEIQTETASTVNAFDRIRGTIISVSEVSVRIAGAVEQQSAFTNEISCGITDVMTEMGKVNDAIAKVAMGSIQSGASVIESLWAADNLKAAADQLTAASEAFVSNISAQI